MKTTPSLLATLTAAIALVAATPAFAATAGEVVDTLHEAEKSPTPLPLLQKAKEQYQHFNPAVHSTNSKYTPRTHDRAANTVTREHKEVAMEKLDEAIAAATAGQSPIEKIHAAIAEIHLSDQNKH